MRMFRGVGGPAVPFGIGRARRYAGGRGRDIVRGIPPETRDDREVRGRACCASFREKESDFPPIDPRIVAFTGHRNPTANCEMGPLSYRDDDPPGSLAHKP